MLAGVSEADSEIRDLLHAPSGSAPVPADRMLSSSDEDTSDEAFAGRHAALEAEEQHRFNSFAGNSLPLFIAVDPYSCAVEWCKEMLLSGPHSMYVHWQTRNAFLSMVVTGTWSKCCLRSCCTICCEHCSLLYQLRNMPVT